MTDLFDAYKYARQHGYRAIAALKQAREDVANGKRRYPGTGKPYFGNWGKDGIYYMDSFPTFWRNLGNVGEIRSSGVNHTGWYTNEFQDDTVAGYVIQLPARNGKPFYIPGVAWTGCDGVSVYPLDSYDDIRDCAYRADKIAERLGEDERAYQEAWRAGTTAAECDRESKELRTAILQVCKDLRTAKQSVELTAAIERLCGIAREKVRSLLSDLYKAREKRDKLRDDYGSEDAFKEGFAE